MRPSRRSTLELEQGTIRHVDTIRYPPVTVTTKSGEERRGNGPAPRVFRGAALFLPALRVRFQGLERGEDEEESGHRASEEQDDERLVGGDRAGEQRADRDGDAQREEHGRGRDP